MGKSNKGGDALSLGATLRLEKKLSELRLAKLLSQVKAKALKL